MMHDGADNLIFNNRLSGYLFVSHHKCFAHTLQLVIKDRSKGVHRFNKVIFEVQKDHFT